MRRRCPCTDIIDAARSFQEGALPTGEIRAGCIHNLSYPLSSELESCRTQSAFLSCKPYCEDSS